MNRIQELDEKLAIGEINEVELDILYDYYNYQGQKIWRDFIREKDLKKKDILMQRRNEFETKDTNFLKVYVEYLIFKAKDN